MSPAASGIRVLAAGEKSGVSVCWMGRSFLGGIWAANVTLPTPSTLDLGKNY